MMSNQLTEREVLQQLNIPDFRHITKDKVMTFASMLQNMEPEVAKKVLEQFPEFAKMTLEVLKDYKEVMEKTLDNNSESSKQCFDIYNEVMNALKSCLAKDDISFEEKKFYIDKMMEIAKMAESKDLENKGFNWRTITMGTLAVLTVLGIGASILGGNTNIKLPNQNYNRM
jgi:glycyl-tRNA synthetase alpha subunit